MRAPAYGVPERHRQSIFVSVYWLLNCVCGCFRLISDIGTLSGQRRLTPRAVLHSEKLG